MRKLQRWAESACIQEEKGKKIKRWRRGNDLLREVNTKKWLGQNIADPIDIHTLEEKISERIDTLIDDRDKLNERKTRIRQKIEAMKSIKEGERVTPSFFRRMQTNFRKEEIFTLADESRQGNETSTQEEMNDIATNFYTDLW